VAKQAIIASVNHFSYFDKDKSGAIDANEFVHLYDNLKSSGFHLEDLEKTKKVLDKDGNGEISLLEYIDWLFRIGSLTV